MGKQRAVHIGGKSLQVLLGGFCFSSFCGCLIGVALYGQTGRLCYPRFRGYMLTLARRIRGGAGALPVAWRRPSAVVWLVLKFHRVPQKGLLA